MLQEPVGGANAKAEAVKAAEAEAEAAAGLGDDDGHEHSGHEEAEEDEDEGDGREESEEESEEEELPTQFAEQLWDQYQVVFDDVDAQAQLCARLVRYLCGRLQLEQEYSKRLQGLSAQLPVPGTTESQEAGSVLLRPATALFGAIRAGAEAVAAGSAARAAGLRRAELETSRTWIAEHLAWIEALGVQAESLKTGKKRAVLLPCALPCGLADTMAQLAEVWGRSPAAGR